MMMHLTPNNFFTLLKFIHVSHIPSIECDNVNFLIDKTNNFVISTVIV